MPRAGQASGQAATLRAGFEVERKSSRKLVRASGICSLLANASQHRGNIARIQGRTVFTILATIPGSLPERFYSFKDAGFGLFPEHSAEEHTEGADVASKRRRLKIARRRGEFREALRPGRGEPQGRHD
jgi:hypothetical protein